jgi:uncharacterized protein GlcG (DUF336 family)
MTGADRPIYVGLPGSPTTSTGLDGLLLPGADTVAAISKAVTAAYLSSEGNAFSTRTASQIVQKNFNPGETNQSGGPLFGVQFSQLPCSDFVQRGAVTIGPHRSPLGMAADPGGLPLYKGGTPVGGIGVIVDDEYSLDPDIMGFDSPGNNLDEILALAASFGFAAPLDRRADRITVEGKILRFSDALFDELATNPANAPAFAAVAGSGALEAVADYNAGAIVDGQAFGQIASGIATDGGAIYFGRDAFIFVDAGGTNRYPPTAGSVSEGAFLSVADVTALIDEALGVANKSRAQIRRPLGSQARVTISVVDTDGTILGMARTRDAPVFGADVSLQKARTAAFFSSADAANFLQTDLAGADAVYLGFGVNSGETIVLGDYVTAVQNFMGDPNALTDGFYAFSDRAGGNLSRPNYPDGLQGRSNGPLSKSINQWSPFSTGLQLDLSNNAITTHVAFALGLGATDTPVGCAGIDANVDGVSVLGGDLRLANGTQIFPGSVPIFKDGVLAGGIGVSGDGIDQDDMISFLAVDSVSQFRPGIANAPIARRADNLTPKGVRLRYVQCPFSPFLNSNDEKVCDGK